MFEITKEKNNLEDMQVRSAEMKDVDELFELFDHYSLTCFGESDFCKEDLVKDLQTPGLDLEKDTRLIFDNGRLAAAMIIFATSETPVHPFLWGAVHSEYEKQGMGTALLTWAEERAQHVKSKVPADARIAVRTEFGHGHLATEKLMSKMDFECIRQSYRMFNPFDAEPQKPQQLEGFTFRSFDENKDIEKMFWAIEDSFKDHFGFVPRTPEFGLPRFRHSYIEDHAYDPGLWQIAEDGDQVAGFLIGRTESYDDPEVGHVSMLGVLRPWRGKGLASYMLRQTFYEQYQRGKKGVDLHVDASNLTGALRLYKKVGMNVDKVYDTYEKEIRPGKEISTVTLEGQ